MRLGLHGIRHFFPVQPAGNQPYTQPWIRLRHRFGPVVDLHGQLAGRRGNDGLNLRQLRFDFFHQRNQKSMGLAGAGFRNADDVPAF